MKSITEYILEENKTLIDMDWIDDENPVETMDGNPAIIQKVKLDEVPNVIVGKVKFKNKLLDFEWDENGICIKATDQFGNPKQPHENDNLVKAKV